MGSHLMYVKIAFLKHVLSQPWSGRMCSNTVNTQLLRHLLLKGTTCLVTSRRDLIYIKLFYLCVCVFEIILLFAEEL